MSQYVRHATEHLRALIEKFDTDIDGQKKALRQLEHRKSEAQRQLNAFHDPITQLPLEISSGIFLHCLPVYPGPNALQAPLLLTNICSSWSRIALSTHELWARINVSDVEERRYRDLASLLDVWLSRAGTRPVSLVLNGSLDDDVIQVLKRHMWRVRELDTTFEDDDLHQLLDEEKPAIKVLRVQGCYPTSDVLSMLPFVPNVVDCAFENVTDAYGDRLPLQPVIIPSLQHLILGHNEKLLDCLTLSSLQSLALAIDLPTPTVMANFLKRSSPPLQKLTLGCAWEENMEEAFSHLHSLTHLELVGQGDHLRLILATLAESPQLLPNLSDLSLNNIRNPKNRGSWHSPLLAMLVAHCTKINIVHITLNRDEVAAAQEMFAEMEALLGGSGMNIYLTTLEK